MANVWSIFTIVMIIAWVFLRTASLLIRIDNLSLLRNKIWALYKIRTDVVDDQVPACANFYIAT